MKTISLLFVLIAFIATFAKSGNALSLFKREVTYDVESARKTLSEEELNKEVEV